MVSAVTAVFALAIAGVLFWKKRAPKFVALLALVGGAGLTDGMLGRMLRDVVGWASAMVGQLTSQAVGVAVPAVLAVVLLIAYVHDVWPSHPATKATAAMGLVLPVLAASIPGVAGATVTGAITAGSAAVGSMVGAVFGGGA